MVVVEQLKEASDAACADLGALSSALHGDPRAVQLRELQALMADKNVAMVVARDGERIVGMGTIYLIQKIGNRKFYLEDLIVDAAYRGQGIGGNIVHALVDIARQRGARSVELMTRVERADAHRFYEKLGFKDKHRYVFQLMV